MGAFQYSIVCYIDHTAIFSPEDLTVLERYFNRNVVSPPYKMNNLLSFCRMLTVPVKVLRDFVLLIKKQMYPDSGQRWRVEVCLTLPHETSLRLEKLDSGMPSMVVQGDKVLYVVRSLLPHLVPSVVHFGCHCPINLYDLQLRFTRIGESQGEAISQFSVPMVLEIGSDTLQVS